MITVIIPTYKRAQFIERAIDSVLNQTYNDFEIIVVDDNNPKTEERKALEEKMQKYLNNDKVIFVQHEKNKNGAAARNTALKIAKGNYITFLDDDDYYMPRRLEVLKETLDKDKEFDAVYSSCITIKKSKISEINYATKNGEFSKDLLMQKSFFSTGSNLFFRANILRELNGFDETFTRHQDIELMIRFFEKHKILNVKEILVVRNEDDRRNVPNIQNMYNVKEKFFNKFLYKIQSLDEKTQKEIYFCNFQEIYKKCLRARKYKQAKNVLKRMKEYKNITQKDKIKTFYYIINNYIPIDKIKLYIRDKELRKKIDNYYINLIKKYEEDY